MTIRRTDALRNDLMEALNLARGADAQIQIRSGVNAGSGGQGTLLAELVGNATGWGVATNGVLTSNAITSDSSANATGTAGHYQLNTVGGVFLESGLLDGSDGATITNSSIIIGDVVEAGSSWVNIAAYDDGI